jgi:predicted glycogen debranching enzyme
MNQHEEPAIKFGRDICGNYKSATAREWLVTNGIGGYASGTISGVLTRRYHGLLIAALKPPLDRKLLLTKLDETVDYAGEKFDLFANRWVSTTNPHGYRYADFRISGDIGI